MYLKYFLRMHAYRQIKCRLCIQLHKRTYLVIMHWRSLSFTKQINPFIFSSRFFTYSHTHTVPKVGFVGCWIFITLPMVNDAPPGLQPTQGGPAQFQGHRQLQFWHVDGGTWWILRSWISLSLHPWPCQRGCPKPKTCCFWWKSWVSIPMLGRVWKINLTYAKAMWNDPTIWFGVTKALHWISSLR